MRIKRVDPTTVKVPEVRVTAVYDEELTALLRDSLASMGQIQPIICVQTEGDLFLTDGLHRLQEAIDRSDKLITVAVYDGDEVDVMTQNLVLNRLRGKTKASEMVGVIKYLYQEKGLDPDTLRDKTGLSRDYIEKILRIGEASPSVQEALDAEVIGVSHAFQISRIPSFIAQDEIVAKYQVWKWTIPALKEQVDQVLSMMGGPEPEPQHISPPTKREYKCEACKAPMGLGELRPVLVCPGCFGGMWRAAKATDAEGEFIVARLNKPPDGDEK